MASSIALTATAARSQTISPPPPPATAKPDTDPSPPPPEKISDTQNISKEQADAEKFKYLDQFAFKGWITPTPSFADTITRDAGGWRSKLADAGFGLSLYSINLFSYDFARAGAGIPGPQLYNGQKFTAQTSNQIATLTYDLGKIGLDGGQLVAQVSSQTNSYQARNGVRGFRLKAGYWHQMLASGKGELEIGLIDNVSDYMGTNVGGSLASGSLGPQASIPVETGLSYGQYNAPTVSLKINWSKNFYTRTGVQRSLNPQGIAAEVDHNPSGFTFSEPGAKALFIQEAGYRINAKPNQKYFWLRGGGFYNTSDYKKFAGGYSHNHAEYIAVDRQFTQPDDGKPNRGLYGGLTYERGLKAVDQIDRYYEARVYMKGPFASRSHDMLSLVATYNHYSPYARANATTPTFTPYSGTQQYTAGYSFRIMPGLYVQPGVVVIVHPLFNQNLGTVVNGLFGLNTFF